MSISSKLFGRVSRVALPAAHQQPSVVAVAFTVRRNLSSRAPKPQVFAEPLFSNKQVKKWTTVAASLTGAAQTLITTRNATRITRRTKQQAQVKQEEQLRQENVDVEPYQTQNQQMGQQQQSSASQQQQQTQQYQEQQQEQQYVAPSDVSLESLITPEISAHLVKVYNTLAMTVGLAAVGGAGAMFLVPAASLGGVALMSSLLAFGGILGIAFSNREKVNLRQGLLMGTGLLMGAGIAPLLSVVSPGTIIMAFAGTAAIFAGFSVAALRAKSDAFLKWGGPLMGGLFLLVGISLFSMLSHLFGFNLPPAFAKALYNINLYGGLILFSAFISFDTQTMIHDARQGNTDHVSHALNMFLNVINIFVRLLAIFRGDD